MSEFAYPLFGLRRILLFIPTSSPGSIRCLSTLNTSGRRRNESYSVWGKKAKIGPGDAPGQLKIHDPELSRNVKSFLKTGTIPKGDSLHLEDLKRRKISRIRRKIIEDHIPRHPNLLTWAAKEQVRFLHHLDPEKYSLERLAESFPVFSGCLVRICRKPNSPHLSEEAIREHDAEVEMRWKALKSGKNWRGIVSEEQMELYQQGKLRKIHFNGDRNLPTAPPLPKFIPPQPVPGPFTALIQSSLNAKNSPNMNNAAKHKYIENVSEQNVLQQTSPSSVTSMVISKEKGSERDRYIYAGDFETAKTVECDGVSIALDLETEDDHDASSGVRIRLPDRTHRNLRNLSHEKAKTKILDRIERESPEVASAYQKWFAEREGPSSRDLEERDRRMEDMMQESAGLEKRVVSKYRQVKLRDEVEKKYSDRIVIPPEKRQEGVTYQSGDSFYNDQGELLFRVPGLQSQSN